MSDRTCLLEGCERPRAHTGIHCVTHKMRLYRTGTTDPGPLALPKLDRFWLLIDKSQPGGCWRWTGAHHSKGYGWFYRDYVHRFSWELHSGEKIPRGMQIDHKCHVRDCVNPDHLQVVTLTENNQNHSGAKRSSKTGIRGVSWSTTAKKWQAMASHKGVRKRAYYDDIEEAASAVIEMRNALHTNNLRDRRQTA